MRVEAAADDAAAIVPPRVLPPRRDSERRRLRAPQRRVRVAAPAASLRQPRGVDPGEHQRVPGSISALESRLEEQGVRPEGARREGPRRSARRHRRSRVVVGRLFLRVRRPRLRAGIALLVRVSLVDELRERRRARDGALGDAQGRDAPRDVADFARRARVRARRRNRRRPRFFYFSLCFFRTPRFVRLGARERDRDAGDVVFVQGAPPRARGDPPDEPPRARRVRVAGVAFRGVPSSRARRARRRTRRLPEHAHVEERVFLGVATRRRRNAGTQARGRTPPRTGGHGETNARGSKSPSRSVAFAPRRVR